MCHIFQCGAKIGAMMRMFRKRCLAEASVTIVGTNEEWQSSASWQLAPALQCPANCRDTGTPILILIQDINTELWGCVARVVCVCECVDNECVINKCHVCCVCVCCGHNGSSLCFPLVTPPAGHPWVSTVPRHQSLGVPHCGWTRILTPH